MGVLRDVWANCRDEEFHQPVPPSPRLIRHMRMFHPHDDPAEHQDILVQAVHDERGYRRVRRELARQYRCRPDRAQYRGRRCRSGRRSAAFCCATRSSTAAWLERGRCHGCVATSRRSLELVTSCSRRSTRRTPFLKRTCGEPGERSPRPPDAARAEVPRILNCFHRMSTTGSIVEGPS